MNGTPILAADRLMLRPRIPDDADALFPTLSDAELMRWWSRPPFASIEEVRENFRPRSGQETWRCWAITPANDDRPIGFVATLEKRQGKVTELGYILAREQWGKGIALEAVSAVIDQLFAEGQRRLFADTDPENAASIALLERLGFQREGLLRAEWETHLGVRDSVILGLLCDEWRDQSLRSTFSSRATGL